jgi:methylenetetrahydrofolate dehydrogenase (NADP+)/methenyltetrahydrofolate cyclohydrolase
MRAETIDGKAVAATVNAECRARVESLKARGVTPGIAVVIVGENPASRVYVRNKMKVAQELGMRSEMIELPADVGATELRAAIERLNADSGIHGFLVQLPLPQTLDAKPLLEAIAPRKDIDGFHRENVGALVLGEPGFVPCTPAGCMRLLASAQVRIQGAHAVVVGRSNIVGKPMAMLLLNAGATVTVCHSQTRDLAGHTRRADILIAAVGRAGMITADMIKPGAAVIDVGINRSADGRLLGDVDFASAAKVAGWITPVPGGVGPMTVAMLMSNTLTAAERATAPG